MWPELPSKFPAEILTTPETLQVASIPARIALSIATRMTPFLTTQREALDLAGFIAGREMIS